MINKKKYRNKPNYKKFCSLKLNVQNKQKLLKFKNAKWQFFLSKIRMSKKVMTWVNKLKNSNKRKLLRRRHYSHAFFDQKTYSVNKFTTFFSKRYKQTIENNKSFKLFYGNFTKKYLKHAVKKTKPVSNQINRKIYFTEFLESRIDVILLRSHFVLSIMNARQLISHGHVFVNKKRVEDAHFRLKEGDTVTFSKKGQKLIREYLTQSKMWPLPPYYLQISYKIFQIILTDNVKLANTASIFSKPLNLDSVLKAYSV
jgi:ribosomal protein S4